MLNPLCRSLMSISPLPLLVPSFPPPNPPLPPELIDQIIRSLPLYPARNRRRALGRCCLVNRLFLDISRPLLYNEVPAMLEEPEVAAGRQLDRLTETLASSSACREMVKGVKLSTYEGELGLDGYESVDVFLREAKQLEAVRVVWIGEEGLDESGFDVSPMFNMRSDVRIGYYLVTSILRHQPGLKQLVLPTQCHLEYDIFAAVFTKLLNLDTFVGSFVTLSDRDNKPFLSPCHLQHLTICSRFEHSLFRQVVHSSYTSLTSFTFPLDTADNPLDLSIFPNLNYLHISLRSRPALSVINRTYATTSEHFARFVAQTLRPLLLSAQSLAISTFKITTPSQNVETFMSQQQIFDLLPPTLAHLTSNPLLLRAHESNFEILAKDMRDRSYPHLKTITLQPSGTPDRFNREEEVKQAVERVCRLFKIQLNVIDREEECCRMEEKWRESWWSESEEESEG